MSRGALEYLSASDWIWSHRSPKKYLRKDQTLIREGSMPKTVYLLRSGKGKSGNVQRRRPLRLVTLGPGSIFGEMALFEDAARQRGGCC